PLWDALAQQHPAEMLFGVFLKFGEAINALGLPVAQPSMVANLTEPERQQFIGHFNGVETPMNWNISGSGITPLMALEAISEDAIPPPPLGTGDLKPLMCEDVKRRVTQAFVASIPPPGIGQRIEPGQLGFWVDTSFDVLCDGFVFRFEPVY